MSVLCEWVYGEKSKHGLWEGHTKNKSEKSGISDVGLHGYCGKLRAKVDMNVDKCDGLRGWGMCEREWKTLIRRRSAVRDSDMSSFSVCSCGIPNTHYNHTNCSASNCYVSNCLSLFQTICFMSDCIWPWRLSVCLLVFQFHFMNGWIGYDHTQNLGYGMWGQADTG